MRDVYLVEWHCEGERLGSLGLGLLAHGRSELRHLLALVERGELLEWWGLEG